MQSPRLIRPFLALLGVLALLNAATANATPQKPAAPPAASAAKPASTPAAKPSGTTATRPAPLPPPSELVPVDPAITVGRLPNGLRYYIKVNRRPEQRAELRLVVNAGSILEDDDQRGLAHVVEHMAFNGSKDFPGQEIGAFMESIGMRGGPSLNAFTTFDDTTFVMQVPTNMPGVLEKSFQIMENWAAELTFDPKKVDKERGIVIEEWREGRGAGARIQEKLWPVLLKGSRYTERNPIGTKPSIETFAYDRLRQFYKDWYRPDLMAVVAVGDFDKAQVEQFIKERFSSIPARFNPKPRPAYPVPDQPGTAYVIATDPELAAASVSVYNKLPLRDQASVLSYRERILDHLYSDLLNGRLAELTQQADPPFIEAGVERDIFVRTKEAAVLSAQVAPEGITRALTTLLTESARVAQHGFTATELEREKRDLLRVYEQAVGEVGKDESAPLAAEYIRNFLTGEPIPGIKWEYDQHVKFLPGITLAEVNALAREWSGDHNRVIVVTAPQRDGVKVPTETELAAAVASTSTDKPLQQYVDTTQAQALMTTPPKGGTVVKERVIPEIGVTELQLSNGVKVALAPTRFKQDEVVFRGTSPGGASLASDADYIAAVTSPQVIGASGVANFDLVSLRKVLSGKMAIVTPVIGDAYEGLVGGGSAKDLETILQLIYLQFTQPRADPAVFAAMTSQMKSITANRQAMPEAVFEDTVQTTLSQNHLRERPMSPQVLSEMDLAKSLAFYKDRFADASGFTFVFSGSFDPQAVKPLIARYLGALPSTNRHETYKDEGIRPPKGVIEKTVVKGLEPSSRVRLVFSGPMTWTPEQRLSLKVLGMVLEGQLGAVLRESQSATYGVKVTADSEKAPFTMYRISIDFNCAPERADAMVKSVFQQIARLRRDEMADPPLADLREALLREYETSSKQNVYIANQLMQRYEDGEDLRTLFDAPKRFQTVNAEMVRQAANTFLDPENYVRVTLVPEKK